MHVARTARREVADHVVAHLAGVLARACTTGRPVQLLEEKPHAVRLLREGEGNAAFSILTRETGGEALVTCSAFWSLDGASAALAFAATVNAARLMDVRYAINGHLESGLLTGRNPALLVWFEPAFASDLEAAEWLGEAERCIAWTLVEHPPLGFGEEHE